MRGLAPGTGRRGESGRPSGAGFRTADFDYPLPRELVASRPAPRRDGSRLLLVRRSTGALEDRSFRDLSALVPPGDALVLNDTRVFPARLLGRKPTGARAEVLLLRPLAEEEAGGRDGEAARAERERRTAGEAGPRLWEALVRPGGKLKPGRRVVVAEDLEVVVEAARPGGGRAVRLRGPGDVWELVERHGRIPLPPYIERQDDEEDRNRYQTVYARNRGSVAAPTAGLHFTQEMLESLEGAGVRVVRVTLHVGPGTFRPVEADRPGGHVLHAERYRVEPPAAGALTEVRRAGGRIWAVGTTVCRVLETVAGEGGGIRPGSGWTDLFIHPPYTFRAVDRLLTNFHLPRSSLLMLVSAFAGHRLTMAAYARAVAGRYRFYSYGDAMLVV